MTRKEIPQWNVQYNPFDARSTGMEPTRETYDQMQLAYAFFNAELFAGELPPCLITLQRKRQTYGYFCHSRFENRDGDVTDEIALNPEYFGAVPEIQVLQTLVHEMTHLWQAHFGKPGRGRYHNGQWAARMEDLGLVPSHTGKPGGRKTGDHMADYVAQGGTFERVANCLLGRGFKVVWADRLPAKVSGDGEQLPPNRTNREKFRCPSCGAQAWGKPSLTLRCGLCEGGPTFEKSRPKET